MKLDAQDLQFENFGNFDGTFAYAQNKVSQPDDWARWLECGTRLQHYKLGDSEERG